MSHQELNELLYKEVFARYENAAQNLREAKDDSSRNTWRSVKLSLQGVLQVLTVLEPYYQKAA